MSDYQTRPAARSGTDRVAADEGLRAYMLTVYNYMALGVAVTGLAALGTYQLAATSPAFAQFLFGPGRWIAALSGLGLILFMSFRVDRLSVGALQAMFWTFAALLGVWLSMLLIIFTGQSIVRVFFITAAMFGSLSLYGYTTKRDLSPMRAFLFMGLIGLIIALLVNMFFLSSMLHWVLSVIGVLVFAGYTAYDTQQIKEMYYVGDGTAVASRKAIMGALRLYLDFLNMFIFLLHLFGSSRE